MRLAADRFPAPGPTPVLLLHGGGQTRGAWGETGATLAARGWPAIAVDLRGHGESGWAPDRNYSLDAFGEDVDAIVRWLDAPPVLVGASVGGIASMLAIADDPDLPISGLVLVDIAHRFDPDGARRIAGFMGTAANGFDHPGEASDAVAEYLPHRERPQDGRGIVRNLRLHEGRWHWHWDPALLEIFAPVTQPAEVERLTRRLEAALGRLRVPALLVRGAHSDVVTPAIAAEFPRVAPTGEVVEVAGARHMVAGDSNDPFTAAVVDFLERRVRA